MKSLKSISFKTTRRLKARKLPAVYRDLRRAFGHQHWWPGRTPFEIMVGAILTQNTAWTNVEKAIRNLRKAGVLNARAMVLLSRQRLAALIRPSGYFNVKSARLQHFARYLRARYGGSIARMKRQKAGALRDELLRVNGIGPETADSILLYALEKPVFVIDAYTKRVFSRHGLEALPLPISKSGLASADYHLWQAAFTRNLPSKAVALFNDYHAQIVLLAKKYCKASIPLCELCPLNKYLKH